MTVKDLVSRISARVKSQVEDGQNLGGKVGYDNVRFSPDASQLYVTSNVVLGQKVAVEVGSSRLRWPGVLVIGIFIPVNRGDGDALDLASIIEPLFTNLDDNGVRYRTAYTQNLGRVANTWQINVTCPFFADNVTP